MRLGTQGGAAHESARSPARSSSTALLLGLTALSLFPLLWMLSVSFMPAGEASALPPPLLPAAPTLDNYRELFVAAGMGRASCQQPAARHRGDAAVAAASTRWPATPSPSCNFRGRERIFQTLLGALVIPGQVAMMPLFLLLKQMGLVNTYGGVIVPALASIFGIFLVRQYARTHPRRTARGRAHRRRRRAAHLRHDRRAAAASRSSSTLAIFTLPRRWNDFMWPLIVLSDDRLHTLPVALAALSREHVQDNELMMAGSVVTVLPVLRAVPRAAALLHPGPAGSGA